MSAMENAGHILINIIWIQGVLVDLIIFKEHPEIIKSFTATNKSQNLGKYRQEHWKKNFSEIIERLKKCFPKTHPSWFERLKYFADIRNAIAHGRIFVNKDYILYEPDSEQKTKKFEKHIKRKKPKSQTIQIKFDDKNFKKALDGIIEFDQKFFPSICKKTGINYNQIK
ncbi:MAG: hypothetical protein PHN19_02940 [Patescibacteria group bacterium]|nr:hypothetical protein [Patescibacteria group bacterium]